MNAQDLKNSILQLAIQGKLVEQRSEEGTAKELLEQIKAEKERLIKEGKIKKEKPLPEITEDEIPFEIPESWEWVRIGEIFILQAGKNITSSDIYEHQSEENKYPCYGGNGLRGYVKAFNRDGKYALIGRQGALCGNINYAEDKFYATEHAVVVEHIGLTDVMWCGYFLTALNLNQYATATAQPGLAVSNIVKILIPMPPYEEQKRIVAKIEELMPYVEKYGAAHVKLKEFNKKFPEDMQKSILQYAIQGKLVEQRKEEGTAEELYQQIQGEKARLIKEGKIKKEKLLPKITEDEIPFEIPGSWKWVRLRDLGITQTGNTPSKTNMEYYGDFIPFISSGDILNGVINYQNQGLSETGKEVGRISEKNSVLQVCIGGSIGKCAINIIDVAYNQQINAITPIISNYLYIYYLMDSRFFLLNMKAMATGTATPIINKSAWEKLIVPLPPLEEQKRIVAKIEEILPYCQLLVR